MAAAAAAHGVRSTGVFDFARELPSPFPVGWHVYGPTPKQGSDFGWLDVHIPAGTDQRLRESGLAQIAAVLWHDHPATFLVSARPWLRSPRPHPPLLWGPRLRPRRV